MYKISTFIMAGGRGKRLSPLTQDRAKPAVPFGGIYRIIDFTLSNCVNSGLRRIHVLTQYKSLSLSRHIRMGWHIFDSELDEYIELVPAQQWSDDRWYQGTADSIYQNFDVLEVEHPDFVMILAGDHIYKMNYKKMIRHHATKGADATIGVVEIPKEKASEFGILEVDGDGKVIGFAEKPEHPKEIPGKPGWVYASMGIYIFTRNTLEQELKKNVERKDTTHDFGKDIIPTMLKDKLKVYTFNLKEADMSGTSYWRDIGSRDAYYEANMDLVNVKPEFNLYDKSWPIRTYHEQFPPAKFVFAQKKEEGDRCGRAIDSLVSDGCVISGGLVQGSVLSPNVRINSFSEVYDSVLMEGVDVGRFAKIKRAIIDKDVKIPPKTQIGYNLEEDRGKYAVSKKGVVLIPKGAVIK